MSDLYAAAQAACNEVGVIFQPVHADNRFHPLDVEGKASRNGAGRIKLFSDGEGGQVWNHVTDDTRLFWARGDQVLTPVEQIERKQRALAERERAEKELAEARKKAAEMALSVLKLATPPVDNAYLNKKGISATGTLREISLDDLAFTIGYHPKAKGKLFTGENVLIVPVRNHQGIITTIEMIDETGLKAGLLDGQKQGCFWSTGKLPGDDAPGLTIGIGEGVATMITFNEATSCAGIAALSCGNLKAVAQYCRSRYPSARIIIVSDVGNGEQAAIEAARSVNALIVKPVMPEGSTGSDINDLHNECGIDAVRIQIEAAAPVTSPPPATPETPGHQWPEPLPLPEGLPPVKSMEPEMIPAALRGWLMDIANRMQIPPDFSAAAAIVALGNIIGRSCGIFPKRHDDWLVVVNLWGAVIGRPSLMKTPAIAEAQRHIIRLETESREEYQAEAQTFEVDNEIRKISKAAIGEEIKKAIKKGQNDKVEELRERLTKLQADEPTRRRYQTQDGTTEKIGELLNENPRGLLVNRDELIGWFRSLDKAGRESDRAFYLESWNGTGRFTYDRIGRGTLDIDALCLSIFGAITPGPLSDYVYQAGRGGNGDDGLLQRFQVMVWPDAPNEWKNVDRYPDTAEKNRAWQIFKDLSGDIPGVITADGTNIPALRFSPAGQEIFNAWRLELETRLRSDHGLPPSLESHLAKYRSLMPSLALIFHLVDAADVGKEPGPVSEQSAIMAAAWCEYLESHAARVYGGATMPGMEQAREIVKHIKRGAIQDGAKLRDIHRNQWVRLTTPDEVKAGMEALQEYDWLIVEKVSTGGRPSEVVRLNPAIKL